MKIEIITIHCQTNFGSALQCFALHRFLTLNGFENRVIDYRPDYIENSFGKGIKGMIKKLLFSFSINAGKKKYNEFISKNVALTKKTYHNFDELKLSYDAPEILMAGSDQLWNTHYACGRDDSYRLTFTDKPKKMSYGTSLNAVSMPDGDIEGLAGQIKNFNAVSVREKSSAEVLTEKSGREVKLVCDPVFLLDKEEYLKMCSEVNYGDYILVYLAEAGERLDKAVEFAKKKLNCKVISVCGVRPHCKCDIHIKNPGPNEMLSLINGARLILTGSFHATSFSHILHKDFITLPPSENAERIYSLVNISGFTSQVCATADDLKNAKFNLDFTKSDENLEKLREESRNWLIQSIENA